MRSVSLLKINNIYALKLARIFLLVALLLLISAKGWGQPLESHPTATPETVCAGAEVQLDAVASGGSGSYTYTWSSDPAGFTSSLPNPTANPTVTTTYYVTVFDGSTTVNPQVTVTVNQLPVAVIAGPATPCVNSTGNAYSTAAGMTNYTWVVSSGGTITSGGGTGSNTVTVTWTTTGAQIVSVNYTNSNGCVASAPTVYNVTVSACFKTLNLTSVMLQGLYFGGGTMRQASNGSGPRWLDGSADHITVELHSATVYADIVFTATDVPLNTDGTATITTIPEAFNGYYYITIKNRNHIETTTAAVVLFSGSIINYAFDLPSKVFSSNLVLMAGGGNHYAIYGGDSNGDGVADGLDLISVENGATTFTTGYVLVDLNGDGSVDAFDLILAENNAFNFVQVRHP